MTALGITARTTVRDLGRSALVERKGITRCRSGTGHDVAKQAWKEWSR